MSMPQAPAAASIGLVGLGRMGGGMAARLREAGHTVLGYDHNPDITQVVSLAELVERVSSPRIVWVMVPAGDVTESVIQELAGLLSAGDVLVDGGNSYYRDSLRRGAELEKRGIHFLDIGVSGGIWGLRNGFCLMAGGADEAFRRVEPMLRALAAEGGYAHVGPAGAGHFSKMVHNGIEYGMLQAYAEGFDLLHASEFGYDLRQLASLWNHGSVVQSWLLDLTDRALADDPGLESIEAYVDDSGEGRWTVEEAIRHGTPATVIAHSVFARFASRDENSFAMRLIAALRHQFGGHPVKET